MFAKRKIIIALCLAAFATTHAMASDWPQWLGPQRNGVSNEKNMVKQFPESGPKVLWRAPLGKGFSAVSVAAGRLYTMSVDPEGEFAVCLDAATGEVLWRVRTGENFEDKQGGDGPRSTPAIDGSSVYVLGAQGRLFALQAKSGEIIWQKDLGKEFASEVPRWGFSTSPLVDGDLLFVEAGGVDGNFVVDMVIDRETAATAVAVDKKTGRTVWSALNDKMSYSSPIAYTVAGQREVAFLNAYALVGLSPADGSVRWRVPWKTQYDVSAATPVFMAPDKIFISSGGNGAVFRITKNGAEEVWKNSEMKNHFGTSVYYDGHLYGFDESILKCVDAATGEEKWKARGYAKGTLIVANGQLIVLGEQGNLGLVAATPERFNELANAQVMNARCWTAPSLADGIVYLRDEQEIVAVDLRK